MKTLVIKCYHNLTYIEQNYDLNKNIILGALYIMELKAKFT